MQDVWMDLFWGAIYEPDAAFSHVQNLQHRIALCASTSRPLPASTRCIYQIETINFTINYKKLEQFDEANMRFMIW